MQSARPAALSACPATRPRSLTRTHVQASGLGRYIKKKSLDPLETYVPLVLQAQEQLLALKGNIGAPPRRQTAVSRGDSTASSEGGVWKQPVHVGQLALYQHMCERVAAPTCPQAVVSGAPPASLVHHPSKHAPPRSAAPFTRNPVADLTSSRDALRSGAFSGLRDNIRALGEYAVQNGAAADAGALVNGFFRKLEAFDLLLYRAAQVGRCCRSARGRGSARPRPRPAAARRGRGPAARRCCRVPGGSSLPGLRPVRAPACPQASMRAPKL